MKGYHKYWYYISGFPLYEIYTRMLNEFHEFVRKSISHKINYCDVYPTFSVDVLYAKFLNICNIWNCGGINYKLPF